MADHMRTELVLGAVDMATRNHGSKRIALCILTAAPNIRRVNTGRNWSSLGCGIRSGRTGQLLGQCARGIVFREPEE